MYVALLTRNPPLSVSCVGMALGGGVYVCVFVSECVCVEGGGGVQAPHSGPL